MIALDTNHIRRLHPDWEVVTALCDEVDKLRAENRRLKLPRWTDADGNVDWDAVADEGAREIVVTETERLAFRLNDEQAENAHLRAVHIRLDAALIELAHHGDLTPAGKRKLEQIIGGVL